MTYNCFKCNKEFKYQCELVRHSNRKVSCDKIKESNTCDICNITFARFDKRIRHELSNKHILNVTNNTAKTINITHNHPTVDNTKLKELESELEEAKKLNELLTCQLNVNEKFQQVADNNTPITKQIVSLGLTYETYMDIDINVILAEYTEELTLEELLVVIDCNLTIHQIDKFKDVDLLSLVQTNSENINICANVQAYYKFYMNYTIAFKDKQIESAKYIKDLKISKSMVDVNAYIYIVTNKQKANEHIFKVGRTNNLVSRLTGYNTGTVEADKHFYCAYYKCPNVKLAEPFLFSLLDNFKVGNEMYQLNFDVLNNIVKQFCEVNIEVADNINNYVNGEYEQRLHEDAIVLN